MFYNPYVIFSGYQIMCITCAKAVDRETSKLHPKGQLSEKPDLHLCSRVVSFKSKTMKEAIILRYQTL